MAVQDSACEQQLSWREVKADIAFIFAFNWENTEEMKEAITLFLSCRMKHLACQASRMLADSGSRSTKAKLASNPNSPPELLEYLAEMSDESIVTRVAENNSTAADVLQKLSRHQSVDVRCAVAENLNTPELCLLSLSTDESPDVRYRLAENPLAPSAVLSLLADDENPYIVRRAKQTIHRLGKRNKLTSEQVSIRIVKDYCPDQLTDIQTKYESAAAHRARSSACP